MKMKCPRCGARGTADTFLKDRRVRCPKCAAVFIVPDPQSHSPVSPGGLTPGEVGRSENPGTNQAETEADRRRAAEEGADAASQLRKRPQAPDAVEDELRAELEGLLAGTCRVCGKSLEESVRFDGAGKNYCRDCHEEAQDTQELPCPAGEHTAMAAEETSASNEVQEKKIPGSSLPGDFSTLAMIRASWQMTSGVKGSIWAGIAVMFLFLFSLGTGIVFLLTFSHARAGTPAAIWLNLPGQLLSVALAITFLSGLSTIGVRRVVAQSFSWRLVFCGFSQLVPITVAGFLMLLLITCGFFLLFLPGVYLAVGYSLTLPLIVDKGVGPWQAMEMSRRAVHQQWWRIFSTYLLMCLIYVLSMIPFGLGMIWTVPMFFTLTGVIYRLLFGQEHH